MTTIRYFIPEDGDLELQPNVFLAPKARQPGVPPTLSQIKQAFPLPGRYHFRFKTGLGGDTKNGLPVWMDCTEDQQPVYVWRNTIIAKITRLGVEEEDDDDDDDEDFKRPPPAQQQQQQHQQNHSQPPQPPPQQQQQQSNPIRPPTVTSTRSFDIFDAPTASTDSRHPSSDNMHRQTSGVSHSSSGGDLFDTPTPSAVQHSHHGSHHGGSGNLLDMHYGGVAHPTPAASSLHNDFLGMTAVTSPPVSGNYNPFGMQQQQAQQQQQMNMQQQQQVPRGGFDSFGQKQDGPFGGLGTPWK